MMNWPDFDLNVSIVRAIARVSFQPPDATGTWTAHRIFLRHALFVLYPFCPVVL